MMDMAFYIALMCNVAACCYGAARRDGRRMTALVIAALNGCAALALLLVGPPPH